MLEMRPDCEACGCDLPPHTLGAHICSFECTFCTPCSEGFANLCPNCGGELLQRPTREMKWLETHPPSTERKFKG